MSNNPTEAHQKSQTELDELNTRLKRAEGTFGEIIGEVDALVISGEDGKKIFTLQDANYLYRKIIEEMNQGTLTITEQGLILYANHQIIEMLQVPIEKVLGSDIFTWFGSEVHVKLRALLQKSMKAEKCSEELLLNVSDGTKLPVYISINKLDSKETSASLCLIITDLTEIKHKEKLLDAAIQERQALLSLIEDEKQEAYKNRLAAKVFENSVEGIIFFDSNYKITLVNKAFTFISGYTEDEILGQPVSVLHPGYENEKYYESLKKSINLSGHGEAEVPYQRKDGRKILIKLSITQLNILSKTETVYIVIIQDVTIIRSHEKKIEWQTYHDLLTELPNRTLFIERFDFAIHLAQRNHTKLAVILIDIDLFKRIKDTFGHVIGDKLLIEVGKRLQSIVDKESMVSHLGGDEFIILLIEDKIDKVTFFVKNIINNIKQVFTIENNELYITVSIGVSIYPDDGESFQDLYKSSDITLFKVKQEGRDGFQFTNKAIHDSFTRTLKLETAIFNALKNHEFYLLYQPQISLKDGQISGVEALIRWQHSEFGLISPIEFIPLAERTGQLKYIGEWILRTAISQLKIWMDSGVAPFTIAVNISVSQFYQTNFVETVNEILQEIKLTPKYLELELTEGIFIDSPHIAIEIMTSLKKNGISFAIDDFGTGYSSLSYIANLPFSKLKIDKSFITKIQTDNSKQNIVRATISMARSFGMKTIAEGAETKEEVEYLREFGCDEVQGYYFAKPMSATELEAFVKQNRQPRL